MLKKLATDLRNFKTGLLNYLEAPQILDKITDIKREELLEGKRGDGQKITPNYEDLPAFAGWYLNFKKSLPTYKLGDGTPDLYIDGTFHRSLFTKQLTGRVGVYITDSNYSKDFMYDVVITHNTNGTLLDLTADNVEFIAAMIEDYINKNFNV